MGPEAPLFIRLYLDEDVHKRVASALRLRHFDLSLYTAPPPLVSRAPILPPPSSFRLPPPPSVLRHPLPRRNGQAVPKPAACLEMSAWV